jgi:ankyrin repeat protein
VRALLDLGAAPDLANNYGRRPLDEIMAVATSGFYGPLPEVGAIVKLLLNAGADPNLSPSTNVQLGPLHQAARSGRGELVRMLLAHGAIVDAPERGSGQTPWLAAVLAKNLDAAELLKQHGADTTRKDNQMRSVLHLAAQSGAKELIEEGLKDPRLAAEVSLPDNLGNTPLHFATRYQKTDCVRVLLAAGANALACDSTGFTPMHQAATHYSDAVFSIYEAALGAKANWNIQSRDSKETPLHLAAKGGYQSIVTRLLKMNVNVTIKDSRGMTPLLAAVASDQYGPTQALLDHMKLKKLSLEEHDNAGQTALHIAAQRWSTACLTQLLNAGADPDARTPDGDAPLHLAVRNVRLDAVKALIQKGADVTAANKLGATPLDLALESGRQDLAILLAQAVKDKQMKTQPQQPPPKKSAGVVTPPPKRRPPAPGP